MGTTNHMHGIRRLLLAFLILTQGVASADTGEMLDECIQSAGESGLNACQEYAYTHRGNISILLKSAKRLIVNEQYQRALLLYDTGLHYNPGDRGLTRARLLASSDWEESRFLGLRDNQPQHAGNIGINHELDRIKCETLSGEAALSACRRIIQPEQPSNRKLALRSPDYPQEPTYSRLDLGQFHALVIGNNRYSEFNKLQTAVKDAKAVSRILRTEYGFNVTRLTNATRYQIFDAISKLRNRLTAEDNLLIYYAGHGYLDEQTERGYWLPVDAEQDNYANWLSTSDITDMLNGMAATRVMVVADSCYSGTLSRSVNGKRLFVDREQALIIKRLAGKRSRTALTSGGLEPVLDSGSYGHSVFANAFLSVLQENTGVLEGARLFSQLRRRVILAADQTPEYADIRKAGHEGGDFIFMKQPDTARNTH
ncbi:MAG: caspase family protein [Candidatus Thiodiazotropha sp.]